MVKSTIFPATGARLSFYIIRAISHLIYHSTIMSFYHIRSRECAKYEAIIHCSVLFNRFTTGRIPSDAKGETMAKLDESAELNKISVFWSSKYR